MLYLHGGGFATGSTRPHGAFMGKLAVACGIDVFRINYRQPPEHPFPAAWDDALAGFRWLLDQGFAASAIVLERT